MRTCIQQSLIMLLLVGIQCAQAQEEQPKNPILHNIVGQHELRDQYRIYGGVGIVSIKAGYQLTSKFGLDLTVHPRNNFKQGDPIGLGFGEGTGGNNWRNAQVYGQTSLAGYENMDDATLLISGRYFMWSSLFVSAGFVAQIGSWRQVDFAPSNRTIGAATYTDLAFSARTELKNQYTPFLALGIHHQISRFGFFIEGALGLSNKKVGRLTLTTSTSLAPEDLTTLENSVRNGAESESFGIMTYGISFHF